MFLGVLLVNNGAIIIAFEFSKAAMPHDILGAKWTPTFFFSFFKIWGTGTKWKICIYSYTFLDFLKNIEASSILGLLFSTTGQNDNFVQIRTRGPFLQAGLTLYQGLWFREGSLGWPLPSLEPQNLVPFMQIQAYPHSPGLAVPCLP